MIAPSVSTPHPSPFRPLLSPSAVFLMPPPYPAPTLLTYCTTCLVPLHSFFGGITFALSFHLSYPVFGELQDDFSPRSHCSASGQMCTASELPCTSPNPPLQTEDSWVVTADKAGAVGLIPAFAASHPSLEAIPAWAWAGRLEPSLPTQ